MSDRPDFTSNTALNAVADTLDNLPVSINAQTLGSLAVDIAAQSAGDIDINLNTNSVGSLSTTIDGQSGNVGISFNSQTGNVDINFQSQSGAVQSGTEFAATQGNTVSGASTLITSAGSFDTDTLFSNTTGNPVVVEFLSGGQSSGFTDAVRLEFTLRDAGSTQIAELEANPINLPLSLDPGILIPDNGSVDVRLGNNANSSVVYGVDFVGREVV
jgi:hypothetical protein